MFPAILGKAIADTGTGKPSSIPYGKRTGSRAPSTERAQQVESGRYLGSLLLELSCRRPSTSFPPPTQADLCLTRGDTGIAVHLSPAAWSRAENLAASPGRRQEPTETPRPSHRSPPASLARAAGSTAEARPKLAGTLGTPSPPQLPGSPARGQSSRLIFHATSPPRPPP